LTGNVLPRRIDKAFKQQTLELLELERNQEGDPPFKEAASGQIRE
jgi:hypothetical protein